MNWESLSGVKYRNIPSRVFVYWLIDPTDYKNELLFVAKCTVECKKLQNDVFTWRKNWVLAILTGKLWSRFTESYRCLAWVWGERPHAGFSQKPFSRLNGRFEPTACSDCTTLSDFRLNRSQDLGTAPWGSHPRATLELHTFKGLFLSVRFHNQ